MRSASKYLAGGILFLLPFLCNPWGGFMEMQFEVPKLLGAFLLGNIAFSFVLARNIHWAIGLIHFAFASSVLITGFGGMQLYPFAYWLAAIFFAFFAVESGEEVQIFFWKAVALSGLLASFHAYLQMMGFSWPLNYAPDIDSTTPIALLGQQTKLGAFLAICAPVAWALSWYPAFVFIAFIALATKSSMTAYALFCGFAVVRMYETSGRKAWKYLLPMIAGVLLIHVGPRFKDQVPALDDHGRSYIQRDAMDALEARPLFGFGPGGFKNYFPGPHWYKFPVEDSYFKESIQSKETFGHTGGWAQHAHNDYLEVLFDFGLWGFIQLLVALGAIVVAMCGFIMRHRSIPAYSHIPIVVPASMGALAALLANATGNFPWTLSPHFVIGVMAAAILLRTARG